MINCYRYDKQEILGLNFPELCNEQVTTLTHAQMQTSASFAGWDFKKVWDVKPVSIKSAANGKQLGQVISAKDRLANPLKDLEYAYPVLRCFYTYLATITPKKWLIHNIKLGRIEKLDTLLATTNKAGETKKRAALISSDPTIASIDAADKITAIKQGIVTVDSVSADGVVTTIVIAVTL